METLRAGQGKSQQYEIRRDKKKEEKKEKRKGERNKKNRKEVKEQKKIAQVAKNRNPNCKNGRHQRMP